MPLHTHRVDPEGEKLIDKSPREGLELNLLMEEACQGMATTWAAGAGETSIPALLC